MERWYSMIQGITNLNSYLNTMKMQTIWDIAKQNPEKAKIEKQQKQKEISKRISDIRTKLKSGKKLSEKEMRLLKEHAPDLYKKAEAVQQERKNFKEALRNCKTKDDVQRLLSQKMQFCSTVAEHDQEMAEFLTFAYNDEHTSFMATDDYKNMKWESEYNIEKAHESKKNTKNTKNSDIDKTYQTALKTAEQMTFRFNVSEDGEITLKTETAPKQSADVKTVSYTPIMPKQTGEVTSSSKKEKTT